MTLIEKSEKYNYEVKLENDGAVKIFWSPHANYFFNLKTGTMVSWGDHLEDDPKEFPAPNICDLECTTICTGIRGKVCPYCYKANTHTGKNMSFETFKHIIDVFPKSLTQIAIGADATLKSNPDLWKMMEYARKNNIVPNITAVDIDDETADKLVKYCGAVAISYHENADVCANSIKKLTDRGMAQVNMHLVIYEENYEECLRLFKIIKEDPRFAKLNAVVMLSLKQKGRAATGYHILSQKHFKKLCNIARSYKISIGFDSCSSLKAYNAFKNNSGIFNQIIPCESSIESSYINVEGKYYPCSFCEGEKTGDLDWTEGLNVLDCNSSEDFLDKIWNNPKTIQFKNALKSSARCNGFNCRECPMFKI
jgi:hypothetical protein